MTFRTAFLLLLVAATSLVAAPSPAPTVQKALALDLTGSFLFQSHPQGQVLLSPVPDATDCQPTKDPRTFYCGQVEFGVWLHVPPPQAGDKTEAMAAPANLGRI